MLKSLLLVAALFTSAAPVRSADPGAAPRGLAGDWDVYVALSATPKFGFEGWQIGRAHV